MADSVRCVASRAAQGGRSERERREPSHEHHGNLARCGPESRGNSTNLTQVASLRGLGPMAEQADKGLWFPLPFAAGRRLQRRRSR